MADPYDYCKDCGGFDRFCKKCKRLLSACLCWPQLVGSYCNSEQKQKEKETKLNDKPRV